MSKITTTRYKKSLVEMTLRLALCSSPNWLRDSLPVILATSSRTSLEKVLSVMLELSLIGFLVVPKGMCISYNCVC